ncbi:MAG: hypothetical protein A2X22_01925 [Bacteroidetes bacterium GWF2_49_14]|nr:MAG: hypothetical protein A2X22_01925 [Bacteroidetes bacterium GWF2_49_14]HBB92144.1 hypothetical protein [Bacteroidales bacterium]
MNFNRINNITGWIIFAIASLVYLLTIEPTASFWDCGEFIATAKNMEIGHPPGASFWMLVSKFFSLFAFGNVAGIAKMMNVLSALASGFTILFLFWSITHLARKFFAKGIEMAKGELYAIMGAGIVGALTYTFTDSFWFSAVEAEVYAMSSLFTAAVFWAILKWENVADEPRSDRWLILIAYLMGISIGVHILNLLALPAIVLVYYFKRHPVTRKGIFYAVAGSFLLLAILLYGVIQLTIKAASWFELFFINTIGLPYNSGVLIFILLLIGALVYALMWSQKKGKVMWNTIFLMLTFIIIGYSSIIVLPIRSAANPPLDENNPDNTLSLLSYVNREVYGQRPLLYGEYFNAPMEDIKDGKNFYYKKDGKYAVSDKRTEYIYNKKFMTIFPRMYNAQEPKYAEAYKEWGKIKGKPVKIQNPEGEYEIRNVPTFGENLRFFFRYQLGHMYFRYFMWNFSGRQSDEQGYGNISTGNWITGIKFLDAMRLGPQDDLPKSMTENKGRNKYFMLPLILGLIGAWFYFKRHNLGFWTVTLLFIMTGAMIIVYLNEVPVTPRERDYVYVGSFYAFAMFIGIGVLYLYEILKKKLQPHVAAIAVTGVCVLAVPVVLATQNWDDHDRSGRYTAHDFAYNYLIGLDKNALIFTNGDNDTFPLWYMQEVEGVRTDVRVCCMPFLPQDWYIDQLKRTYYESKALPLSMGFEQYRQGKRGYVPILDEVKQPYDLKELVEYALSDKPGALRTSSTGRQFNVIPASTWVLPVNKEQVLQNGTVAPGREAQIDSAIIWTMGQQQVYKDELVILDILAHNNWERPMYYTTPGQSGSVKLDNYLELQGLSYRLIPVKGDKQSAMKGMVNTDIMYENLMNKFKYTNLNNPKVYQDETCRRMLQNMKNNFNRLAGALLDEGKTEKANAVLNKLDQAMPVGNMGYTYLDIENAELWYRAGNSAKGLDAVKFAFENVRNNMTYYLSLPANLINSVNSDISNVMNYELPQLMRISQDYKEDALYKEIEARYNEYYSRYVGKVGKPR